MTFNLPSSF